MATTSTSSHRLASSIRLILAMFRLYADIETGFGKAILDMLKKQYPDQKIDVSPASVGHKMMAIVRKQNQYDDQRSMDVIQDYLTYISVGAKGGKGWDFRADFDSWQKALDAIYSNLRTRGITKSIDTQKRKKREKSTDDAYGKRGEDGGSPEGGEARMPTPDVSDTNQDVESAGGLGKALDDKAAIREFYDLLDMHIPDLKASLSPDTRALFDLIFDDEIGGFGSDIKDNMGQASALKEKHPELYEQNAKRWSGFVGDLRKKLLSEIWNYIDDEMSNKDYARLKEAFFAETTPDDVHKLQKEKDQGKTDYQRGLDERKYAREKWKLENGQLDEKGKKSFEALGKKIQKEYGVDPKTIDAVAPEEKGKKPKKESEAQAEPNSQTASARIAHKLASRNWS